jgi:nicotinamidase-related amidase
MPRALGAFRNTCFEILFFTTASFTAVLLPRGSGLNQAESQSMKALIIVDMQVGCFAGTPPRLDEEGTVRRINQLSAALRPKGIVVFIQHTDANEGLARGSKEWEVLPKLTKEPNDIVVEKTGCDSFLETPLDSILKRAGVTDLIIVGCATDFCVDTTVRSAPAHGYNTTVASDAHTTRDRPHLSAQQVIAHHNYVWADFLLPHGKKIRLVKTEALLSELNPS